MTTQVEKYKYFVCVTQENEMIGLDTASGGYPWIPQSLSSVAFWVSRTEAERYRDTFKKNSGALSKFNDMRVMEFNFTWSKS
jgi:hypothetical protein